MSNSWDAIVVGGGAAGVFAALRAKALSPTLRLLLLERSPQLLRKVAISGGGRCNVTHNCDDLDHLLACYPRGGYRLEPILSRFMPQDTVEWFRTRGVPLKTESDGRMFPVTDSSQTIIDCLLQEAHRRQVQIQTGVRIDTISTNRHGFRLHTKAEQYTTKKLLLATGGGSRATAWLSEFGHRLVPDIPSLFTFNCKDPVLQGLQGLSVPQVDLKLATQPTYQAEGPLLITHWGLSGPAVLKLSAFAARTLAGLDYRATLHCDLCPQHTEAELQARFAALREGTHIGTKSPFETIPKRLWKAYTEQLKITGPWHSLGEKGRAALAAALKKWPLELNGKGVFKEEFVTSGGLPLSELDVYTMESKKVPGLYVAGELLNVDGITGGFNFQNAWAGGYVAGEGLAG